MARYTDLDDRSAAEPVCLPGQRLLHGQVWTFDAGLLKRDRATEALASMPTDLSRLTLDELKSLIFATNAVDWSEGREPQRWIVAEYARRGLDSCGIPLSDVEAELTERALERIA